MQQNAASTSLHNGAQKVWTLADTQHHPGQVPLAQPDGPLCKWDGCTIFPRVDLVKAFHQVPIALKTAEKRLSSSSLDCFSYMPFGMCIAAQTLQMLQDNVFQDLDKHVYHLQALFMSLSANRLAINLEKCKFPVPKFDILGHHLSADSIMPLTSSLQVMCMIFCFRTL
jgi:hypothetical protein